MAAMSSNVIGKTHTLQINYISGQLKSCLLFVHILLLLC